MTSYLTNEQLYDLIKAAVDADLTAPGVRDSLLMGIHRGYVNKLPVRASPLDQLCSDLARMNSTPYLAGSEEVPLRIWLGNATHHLRLTGRLEVALLQRLLDEVDAKSATVIAESSDAQSDSDGKEADYDAIATALQEAYATHEHAAERGSLSISITGAGNVVGDHNTVFVTINQRYPLLSDYAYDVGKTIAAETEWFTGRAFVFEWLETQLHTSTCGYLRLIADAGLGKTAIAAEVARRYDAVVHFINAAEGRTRTDQCLNALAVQLIARYGLKHDHLPERAGLDSDFLQTLLQEAAAVRGDAPILLVIDALDEADATTPGHNSLHLPQQLPQGVFILLTHRPGDYPVAVGSQIAQSEPLRINWDDTYQQEDIEAHLRRQAGRPELQRALASATPPIAVDDFVDALKSAAEGNFMYLAYVLEDIARREPGFDPLNLRTLPRGLYGYYGQFWAQMEQVKGQEGWTEWKNLYRPAIELLGVAGEPVSAEWLAAHTGREAEEITERALARWVRFLRDGRRDGARVWSIIHRSFADFLAGKVNLPDAHRRVAGNYLRVWGGWETDLPGLAAAGELHGGYGLRHLAMHLDGAAWWEPLRALFESDAWLQARVANDGYVYDGYLNDLELAWLRAENEVKAGNADAIAECVRYVLIRSTVNSLASSYEPELIIRAVEVGLWTPNRALSVAAKIVDLEQQAKLLAALGHVVPDGAREGTLTKALVAARKMVWEGDQAEVLAALAPQWTGDLLAEALAAARKMVWEGARAKVLAALAPQLTGDLLAEALAAVREMVPESYREEVLAAPTSQSMWNPFSEDGKARVLESYQAEVLAALAPQLTGDLLAEALAAVREMVGEDGRAKVLAALAPQLTGDLLAEALAVAREIEDEQWRAWVLARLAPQLTGDLLTEALEVAREMADERDRADVLESLAPQLTGDTRERVLAEALAAARGSADELFRATVLTDLAVQLIGDARERVVAEALAAARGIAKDDYRANTLLDLAPHFSGAARESLLAEAVAAACEISPEWLRVDMLARLALQLTGNTRERALAEALAAARGIAREEDRDRARALSALASQLTGAPLPDHWLVANDIADEEGQAQALMALAAQLTAVARERILTEALAAAREISDKNTRTWDLMALAAQLPAVARESVLTEALAAAREISDYDARTRHFMALAAQLAGDTGRDVLAQTVYGKEEIPSTETRTWALAALALQLAGDTRERVLAETLEASREIGDGTAQAKLLAVLAPQLTGVLLTEALEVAQEIRFKGARAIARAVMALSLTGAAREQVLAEAMAAWRDIGAFERSWLSGELAPLLSGAAREHVLVEAMVAMRHDDSWISYFAEEIFARDLAPLLSGATHERVLAKALVTAREMTNEWSRANILIVLAPQLSGAAHESVLGETWAAAREIGDERRRAETLAKLAPLMNPNVRESVLAEALAAAHEIADEWDQAMILAALAPQLTGDTCNRVAAEALASASRISDNETRTLAFAVLAVQLAGDTREHVLAQALSAAREIADGYDRAEVLVALSSFLSSPATQIARQLYQTTVLEIMRTEAQRERAGMLEFLAGIRTRSYSDRDPRPELYTTLYQKSVAGTSTFNPVLLGLTPEAVERIATAVVDICRHWRWV